MAFSTTPSVGNDRLRATAEGQTINALSGDDWIRSIFSGSTLYGGLGHDRITVSLSLLDPDGATTGTAALFGGNGNDWLITEVTGAVIEREDAEPFVSGFNVQQSGGRGNDNLYVNVISSSDRAYTFGEFDVDLSGGTGDDNIWIESDGVSAATFSSVDAGSGSDVVYIYADGNYFGGGGSNTVFAGDDDDEVIARAFSSSSVGGGNTLWGGEGNDRLEATLDGTGGSNELYGEDGDDILTADGAVGDNGGSSMANIVSGGAGNDVIQLEGAAAGPLTSVRNEARGDDGDDEITSIANLGSGSGDYTGIGETILYGGNGNDTLTATTRYNVEDEERGGSTLFGGNGNDILRVYGGIENTLNGGTGDDTITGGSGSDRIIGGSGADLLRGGGGEDAFVYLWTTGVDVATRDTIRGFAVGEDVIDLSAIDANANRGGNQAFIFGGGTGVGRAWVEDSATGTGSIIRANNGGAEQLYIAVEDGTGRDASDWSADDFLL